MSFRVSFVTTLAGAALVISGCGSTTVGSAVRPAAISIDGTAISRKSVEHDIDALSSSKKFVALDKSVAAQGSAGNSLFDADGNATRVLTTSWLNRLANQIIIDRAFKERHLTLTATDRSGGEAEFAKVFATDSADGTAIVAEFPKWFRDQEEAREARIVAVTRALDAEHPVTEAQKRAFYDKNVGSLCPSGFNAAHILVKTLPEAEAIETQLAAGTPFATLAQTKSIDTGSGAQGGSLGCFATGQYVAVFEQAVLNAKVGVPTAPVKSEFGYHIILKTAFVPPTFASVEAEIEQEILKEANYLSPFVAAGLKKAEVRILPLYGTWSEKDSKVVAPKAPTVRDSRNATTTPTS